MLTHKLSTLVVSGALFLSIAVPAGAIEDARKEKVAQKLETKVGMFREFLGSKVAIGSGEVTAISGTTVTVSKDGKTYTVHTNSETKFRRKFWGKGELSEISVGDTVNVIGKWQDDAKTTILAHMVRDVSVQMRHGVFFGEVTTKTDTGFTMKPVKRDTQTVTVDANTKYLNRKEEAISLSDVQVGHRVRVRGLWNAKNSTITETTQVKDFSLPLKSRPNERKVLVKSVV